MKKRIILTALLTLILTLGLSVTAFAEYEADTPYTITVYAGQQGKFTKENDGKLSADGKKWTKKCSVDNNKIVISAEALGLKLNDSSKYYDRGFRVAGHDNDEIDNDALNKNAVAFKSMTIEHVEEDVDYIVAYGLKGAMVAYTINYVDSSGKSLHASDTYYGMKGDKPVVSYRYVEGYYPNAYTQGKTLVEDASKNVYTFTYTAIPANTTTTVRQSTTPGTTSNPTGSTRTATASTTRRTTSSTSSTTNRSTSGTGTSSSSSSSNRTSSSSSSNANRSSDDDSSSSTSSSSSRTDRDDTTTIDDDTVPFAQQPEQYIDIDEEPATLGEFISEHKVPFIIGGIALLGAIGGLIAGLIVHSKNKKKREAEAEEEAPAQPAV